MNSRCSLKTPFLSLFLLLLLFLQTFHLSIASEGNLIDINVFINDYGIANVVIYTNISAGLSNITLPIAPLEASISVACGGSELPFIYEGNTLYIYSAQSCRALISYIADVPYSNGVFNLSINLPSNITLTISKRILLLTIPSNIISISMSENSTILKFIGPTSILYTIALALATTSQPPTPSPTPTPIPTPTPTSTPIKTPTPTPTQTSIPTTVLSISIPTTSTLMTTIIQSTTISPATSISPSPSPSVSTITKISTTSIGMTTPSIAPSITLTSSLSFSTLTPITTYTLTTTVTQSPSSAYTLSQTSSTIGRGYSPTPIIIAIALLVLIAIIVILMKKR